MLVALNLRPAIASVPPVLPDIQRDLGLSGTAAGLLTALPVVCLGVFAPAAAWLAGRLGVDRVVTWALVVLGAGTLARAVGGGSGGLVPGSPALRIAGLFAATLLAGAGLAVGGALLPGIVKAHVAEDRAATVTGLYTTGLAGGALLAAALTVPLRNLLGGWAPALAVWALPAVAALAVWRQVALRPGHAALPAAAEPAPAAAEPVPAAVGRAAPKAAGGAAAPGGLPWRSRLAWRVTLYTGLQSLLFYASLTWLAPLYQARGWSAERAGALLAVFSLTQLVATLGLPVLADRTGDRRPWIALSVGACTAGLAALALAPLAAPWLVAAVIGFGAGGQFAMALTLLVDAAADPAASRRLSGMAFLVGYLLAAAGPAAVGGLYDATGGFSAAFLALTAVGVVTLALGVSVRRGQVV